MRLFEYNFPKEYDDERDVMISRNKEEMPWWTEDCIEKHTGEGILLFPLWSCSREQMLAFLMDVLRADTAVKWTGFRVMIGKEILGWPDLTFELFAKDGKVAN